MLLHSPRSGVSGETLRPQFHAPEDVADVATRRASATQSNSAPITSVPGGSGEAPRPQLQTAVHVRDSATAGLHSVAGRLQTFLDGEWPVQFLSAEDVAAAGFYKLRRGDDTVQCAYCGVVLSTWEPSDDPIAEHEKFSPRCPFLRSRRADVVSYDSCSPYDAAPLQPVTLPQPPRPKATPVHATRPTWPQFRTREARLNTFRDWPPAVPVKPQELSEAGFFYTGVGDRTICFYCGKGLRDWVAGDNPWVEHELWFPGCSHVLLHRGNDFAKDIAEKRDALIAAKQAPPGTTSAAGAPPVEPPTIQQQPARDYQAENNQAEDKPIDEKRLCKICFENEMGVAFMPCGHIVACVECALSVAECPLCRQPFENTLRIYLP